MANYKYHILICGGTGCHASQSAKIKENFEQLLKEKNLENDVQIVGTGCFGFCEKGPIVKMLPDNTFYTQVKPEDCREIIDEHIIKGRKVERLLYLDPKSQEHKADSKHMGFYKKQMRIALRNCGFINPENIDEYIARDGYKALASVLERNDPEATIEDIKKSGLRGRGGADAETADSHSFDDGVRVAFEDGTIHERTWVTLVGVTDHILLVSFVGTAEAPLQTSGEAGAATTTKTGFLDILDGSFGIISFQNAGEGFVTVAGDVLVDVFGVDETAVTQSDTHLFLVEAHVFGVGFVLLALGVKIEEALHLSALDDVLVDDFAAVLGFHLGVERVVRKHLDDGALFAEAETAGTHDLNIIL